MSGEVPRGWRIDRLGSYVEEFKLLDSKGNLPPLSVTKSNGIVFQSDKFNKRIAISDSRNYKVVNLDEYSYDPMSLYYGAIGRLKICKSGIVSPAYITFRVKGDLEKDFFDLFVKTPEFIAEVNKVTTGGNQDGKRKKTDWNSFSSLPILIPPVPEQRRIAEILSSVDEAIAATRAVIAQTRRVKQAVLERLLTKGVGHTRFKQTEIGEIPEEWEGANLFDVLCEPVRNGYSPISPSLPTGGWLLSLGSLSDDGLTDQNLKPAPLDDPRIIAARLSYGDVVISRSNTPERVGMAGIYKGKPDNCYFPDLMICLRFNEDMMIPDFGALWLGYLQKSGYFKRAASGTSASMVKINRALLSQIRIAVPSIGEQKAIVSRASELQLAIGAANEQMSAMITLKSALMSDLLTGRRRVSDPLTLAAE
ncbi:restriction endonuclease subunit S [Xanthobacter sp.]|uniref:restriction endonuclease subunit S n=1 Tax=Xanthobacter sp. TaxID=35809 RepID=UPI0035B10166